MAPEIGLLLVVSLPPLLAIFFIVRLAPVWHERNQGCDAYYFLLCAEEFRNRPQLPIVLPGYYLLEAQEQYYPPGFSIFCSLFPPRWLDRYHWLISHVIDAGMFVTLVVWVSAHAGLALAWGTGIAYAAGTLAMEYRSLTSRPLGVVLFTIFIFANKLSVDGSIVGLVVAIAAGFLILFTHKLSIQLLWFMIPILAIIDQSLAWLFPLFGSYLAALLIGRRFFIDVLRAHADIVRFWHRNWPLLGAHMVRQSPIYGDGRSNTSVHAGIDARSALNYIVSVIRQNYFAPMLAISLIDYPALSDWDRFFVHWAALAYCWALLTLYLPSLRSVGLGTLYVKYAHLPVLVLTASILAKAGMPWPWLIVLVCVGYNIRYYWNLISHMRQSGWQSTGALSGGLSEIIDRIKTIDAPRILCVPTHIADSVAYHTRKPVLWGTHGYGFRQVEAIFPVLRKCLDEIVRDLGATHLLLDRRYAEPAELAIDPTKVSAEAQNYLLIPLDEICPKNVSAS